MGKNSFSFFPRECNTFVYAVSTFMLHGHYISSPNQTSPPEPSGEFLPLPLPYCPTALRKRLWAVEFHPYLAFCDESPFQGQLFGVLGGSVDAMHLDHDRHGWHLSHETAKSWKEREQTLRQIAKRLRQWFHVAGSILEPKFPSGYGYFSSYSTETAARSGLRRSLDAFAVYFAYVSFLVAVGQFTGKPRHTPAWLTCLEPPDVIPPEFSDKDRDRYGNRVRLPNIHPEFMNMFKKSHIVDFSGNRTRTGVIIDVLNCDWISFADVLLKAKVPIWLDWGELPWMVTPLAGWMADYKPQLANLDRPSINMPLPRDPPPSQPECPPQLPVSSDPSEWTFNWLPPGLPSSVLESPQPLSALEVVARIRSARDQRPGETYQKYLIRRQQRNEARMKTETPQDKAVRENRERSAAGRQYPGRKGPAVYYWEPDSNGFRVRTLQTRAEAQKLWGLYSGAQKIFDSFANEWDCCTLFGDDDSDTDDDSKLLSIPKPSPPQEDSSLPPNEEPTPNLPLPDEESIPVHKDPTPNPPPMQEDSILPPHEEPLLGLSPPHEVPTAANPVDMAKSQEIPMDVDVEPLPCPPRSLVSPASSKYGHDPALSHRDDSPMHRRRRRDPRDASPRYHPNTQGNSSGRYQRPCSRDIGYRRPYRDSRDDSPRRYHRNHSRDRRSYHDLRGDSPRRYRHGQDSLRPMHYHDRPRHDNPNSDLRSMRRCSRSRSPESYRCGSSGMVDSDPQEVSDDDLLALSRAIVLSVHPPDPKIIFGIQTDSLEDHVYYRFGFHLDEDPYTDVPLSAFSVHFADWVEVRRSIGCHELDCSLAYRRPITHFLQYLLSEKEPLREVPAKYWDLNASNGACLNHSAGFIRIEPRTFLDQKMCYLIRPVGLHASRDSSWVLAVDAMTALECVRRRLGPHTVDIANFLINRGIPFSTLRRMTSIPGLRTPPRPISNLLGTRPKKYRFDVADFSVYQTVCDSFLKSNPFCRAALCMGGIVARLARENIPNTAALLGPSQDALNGLQKIMVYGDELFCDDELSDAHKDLICGVYKVHTDHLSMYTVESVGMPLIFNRSIFRRVLVSQAQYLGPSWV